jgi:DAACS family dicarboxylate/amino acid:cation (Na+ or H+) symporter
MPWKMGLGFGLGLLFGLVVHMTVGADAGWVQAFTQWVTTPASRLFLNLIFMLIVPLLFSALVMGIAEMGDIRALGRIGWKTLAYTVILSGVAVLLGLVLVNLFQPGAGVDPVLAQQLLAQNAERSREIVASIGSQPTGMEMVLSIVPSNIVQAASENGSILALMFFAVMFGIGMVLTPADKVATLKRGIEGVFEISMTLINLVIRLAPYAVFCFMFNLAALFGFDLLIRLGAYVGVVVLALALHMFVSYGVAVRMVGRSPLKFFRDIQEAAVMGFSTASSNATLPTALRVADQMGLPQKVSRFVLTRSRGTEVLLRGIEGLFEVSMTLIGLVIRLAPYAVFCFMFNLAALFEGVTVIFLAQFFGVELSLGQQFMVMLVCILGGIGTAGVPSGSLPVVALICAMVGVNPIGMPGCPDLAASTASAARKRMALASCRRVGVVMSGSGFERHPRRCGPPIVPSLVHSCPAVRQKSRIPCLQTPAHGWR